MLKITSLIYKITGEYATDTHQFRADCEKNKDELLLVSINVFTIGDNPEYAGSVSLNNGQISSSFMSNNFEPSVFTEAIKVIESLKNLSI